MEEYVEMLRETEKAVKKVLALNPRKAGIIFVGSFGEAEPHLWGLFFTGRSLRASSALIAAAALS